eukprot:TRINITY_DN2098_c0_g1_i1.p1 TRINITY_DN2098_c0_g1~~TRINITY_DN2098_c0_g1_i1.p1  ORF type:complete len:510 (+),score=94.29 TRINITY_DN2098_c0_g1_i1:84-1613(+)
MRAFLLLLAVAAVSAIENCPIYPQTVPLTPNNEYLAPMFENLVSFLKNMQQNLSLPGLVCSVVYDQDIMWTGGYGKNDPFDPNSEPPTIDSVVRIASITKVFTDLMLMLLRDAGVVDLDDPVTKYIPEFSVLNPYKTNRPITLRQLGSQTSGLQREVPVDWYKMHLFNQSQILQRVAQTYLLFPQYDTPHYSNLGLALLGRTLQAASSIEYEDFVEAKILANLGMANSTFDYEAIKDKMAIGTITNTSGTYPAKILDLGWGNPMGGLFSTARDMSKLISFLFRQDETAGGDQILDSNSINEFLKPVIMMNDGYSAFGMPWEMKYITPAGTPGYWVKSKAGSLLGYRSQVAIVPPAKVGVFCVGMTDNDDSTQSMLTIPVMEILLPAFNEALASAQPPYVLPSNAAQLTGTYEYIDEEFGPSLFEVYINGSVLMASPTDGEVATGSMTLFSSGLSPNVLRTQLNEGEECRWLDDGSNLEFIYFSVESGKPTSLTFMATDYTFVSNSCPQC